MRQGSLDNLAKGWGKRPKLNHRAVSIKMAEETKHTLERLAAQYGCLHGGEPWIGGLLARIGSGELLVVPAPPPVPMARDTQ